MKSVSKAMRLAFTPPATVADRLALMRSVGEECVSDAELQQLLEKKPKFTCYDGFEPSGRMHIAQGIVKAINVNKCIASGGHFVFWVADWFALMNDKAGGDLSNIRIVGAYLVEVWRSSGMDLSNVTFRWSSDDICRNAAEYWRVVLDIAQRNTIARIKKCCTIMGRGEGGLTAAQILYPLMQCADIFFLKADVCQLGMDQRKVNMLAREYCDAIRRKLKPIILSHHMLAGLGKGQAKMSKSDPESAIFMEDSAEDVCRKISAAYCPKVSLLTPTEGVEDVNPCLDYARSIVFAIPQGSMNIEGRIYTSYEALEQDFLAGVIHEVALKQALAESINALLQPVRDHFTSPEAAELLRKVKSILAAAKEKPASEKESSPPPPAESSTALLGVWVPHDTSMSIAEAILLVNKVRSFLQEYPNGSAILINADWAFAAVDGMSQQDAQAIGELNTAMLRALGIPESVTSITQDTLFLKQPDAYWYAAINIGRKCRLADLEVTGMSNAGGVVSALMRGADAITLKLTHWVCATNDEISRRATVVLAAPEWARESQLPLHPLCGPAREPGPEDMLRVLDNEMDTRRKVKQSFAAEKEPKNPVVELACVALSMGQPINIKRQPQHGGDLTYTDAESLITDYASGSLHPADLKASVTAFVLNLQQPLREVAATPAGKKTLTIIRTIEKRRGKDSSK